VGGGGGLTEATKMTAPAPKSDVRVTLTHAATRSAVGTTCNIKSLTRFPTTCLARRLPPVDLPSDVSHLWTSFQDCQEHQCCSVSRGDSKVLTGHTFTPADAVTLPACGILKEETHLLGGFQHARGEGPHPAEPPSQAINQAAQGIEGLPGEGLRAGGGGAALQGGAVGLDGWSRLTDRGGTQVLLLFQSQHPAES